MTNPAVADNTATDQVANRSTRRALLGLGVAGAALAASRSVAAAPSGTDLATFAISAELAARDLYALADGDLWDVMSDSHRAFAEHLAGITGVSADIRNESLFSDFAASFESDDPAAAATTLENTLAATHGELLALVEDGALLAAIASIVASESRHAATIASISGADLDTVLVNSAAPLTPGA